MHVAITGAAGFIGGHLSSDLATSHEVLGIDNCRSGDWTRVPDAVTKLELDITAPDVEVWADLLDGVDVLFHLAAEKYNSSRSTPQAVIDTNISATARLLQGAARAKVGQVVFTSSLYAYGATGPSPMRESQPLTPTTYYGMSKAAGENLLRVAHRDHGLHWACARLFFVYGPMQYADGGYKSVILSNFERLRRGEAPVINGSGEQRLDYVYIADVVAALRRLAEPSAAGATLNISSGSAPSINELTALMQQVAGTDAPPVHAPPDWTEDTVRLGDAARARISLGWQATTQLSQGLQDVWDWMNQ
ncbi:MAG: NAD-dependent epimerase/dehydratase family protein [Candidatus Nanopelagicales bacterium]|nr:NAD-dependent epimerase/dehydratase family protein [Candidatus Nanopelagicales bacterium]